MVDDTIFMVRGKPAGGTSCTMRVMIKGGIEGNYSEEHRSEQSLFVLHNPHGTFECGTKTLEAMKGKVTKCMGGWQLAKDLSPHPIKVIFVSRPLNHVAESRGERRERGGNPRDINEGEMDARWEIHHERWKELLKNYPNVQELKIEYTELCENTRKVCEQIKKFVAPHPFDVEKAILAVDKDLYSKRQLSGVKGLDVFEQLMEVKYGIH